jgi:hypothetical protein
MKFGNEARKQGDLFLCGDQPVGVQVGATRESGFGLFKTDLRKGGKIIWNIGGGEKVLDRAQLIGIRDIELKSVGFEFETLAEPVIAGGTQNHECSAAGGQHAVGLMDGSFHLLGAAVIEDAEAENSVEAVIGERQTEHGRLRQQKRGAGVAEELVGVGEADDRDVHAAWKKAQIGCELDVPSGSCTDIQEVHGLGLALHAAGSNQEPDYVVIGVGGAEAGTFVKLIPMRRRVVHWKVRYRKRYRIETSDCRCASVTISC